MPITCFAYVATTLLIIGKMEHISADIFESFFYDVKEANEKLAAAENKIEELEGKVNKLNEVRNKTGKTVLTIYGELF